LRKEHPDVTEPDKLDDLELDLDLSLESLDDPKGELELTPLPVADTTAPSAPVAPMAATMATMASDALTSVEGVASSAAVAAAAAGASVVSESGAQKPSGSGAVATAAAADEGMWVWQYGAPAPLPSFSAVFFGGRGLPELYRFFACGLLVAIGCLLPWGTSLAWIAEQGLPTLGVTEPPAGYQLPMGAVCLALSVWLMFTACYGIYSGRQKILPVFLMLVPAWASWSRTLDALAKVADLPFKLRIEKLFEVAGPGVLLTLVGSTIMALSLVLVILKVLKKKPDDGTARAPRKGKEKDDAGKDGAKPAEGKSDGKPAKSAEASADEAGKRGRKR